MRMLLCAAMTIALASPLQAATATIETVHRDRVPHTDATGHPLTNYESGKSFFPIGLWGQVLPDSAGGPYCDWKECAAAGFNTIWPMNWDDRALELADAANVQLVYMGKIDDEHAAKLKNHPRLLGNMWMDEPTGQLNIPGFDMPALFERFTSYKKKINASMPGLPVFINDPPAIFPDPPKFKQWWLKWNTAGDVSCQDDYPIVDRKHRARSLGAEPTGIPQCVSLAVSSNDDRKPVWTIVGAFDAPADPQWPFRMPTPVQLRAQVYAAIVSGATGIAYFIPDSHLGRRGGIIGMSPRPKAQYAPAEAAIASPLQLIQSKALWETAAQVNAELKELTPLLLSPTMGPKFEMSATVQGEAVTASPLRLMLKRDAADGSYVLLAVNVDDAVLTATVTLPKPSNSIRVLFENRTPPAADATKTKFSDRFEPFDVHVYRLALEKPATQP